jgi:hypothetical protein
MTQWAMHARSMSFSLLYHDQVLSTFNDPTILARKPRNTPLQSMPKEDSERTYVRVNTDILTT